MKLFKSVKTGDRVTAAGVGQRLFAAGGRYYASSYIAPLSPERLLLNIKLYGSNVRQRFSATLSGNFPSGFSESNL